MPLSSVLGAQSLVRPGVCTSTTRPASPFEGQVIYETDTDLLLAYNGSAWRGFAEVGASVNSSILQVVAATKTDTFTTTSGSFTDVTGLSVSITPYATTSKILVLATLSACAGNGSYYHARVVRGSTAIFIGDAAGSRAQTWFTTSNSVTLETRSMMHLDSPATTAATTYKIQIQMVVGAGSPTLYVNRTPTDANDAFTARTASNITVMEVAA